MLIKKHFQNRKNSEDSDGKSIKIEFENLKNLFGQLKNSSTILSDKNMTNTLEEIDRKEIE